MAFFGLTALGPHPFDSLEENNPTLHLFTENDLEVAWKKSDGEGEIAHHCTIFSSSECIVLLNILPVKDTLPLESLSNFLTELYFGSPPESELNRLNELVQDYAKNGRISWVSTTGKTLLIKQY